MLWIIPAPRYLVQQRTVFEYVDLHLLWCCALRYGNQNNQPILVPPPYRKAREERLAGRGRGEGEGDEAK